MILFHLASNHAAHHAPKTPKVPRRAIYRKLDYRAQNGLPGAYISPLLHQRDKDSIKPRITRQITLPSTLYYILSSTLYYILPSTLYYILSSTLLNILSYRDKVLIILSRFIFKTIFKYINHHPTRSHFTSYTIPFISQIYPVIIPKGIQKITLPLYQHITTIQT